MEKQLDIQRKHENKVIKAAKGRRRCESPTSNRRTKDRSQRTFRTRVVPSDKSKPSSTDVEIRTRNLKRVYKYWCNFITLYRVWFKVLLVVAAQETMYSKWSCIYVMVLFLSANKFSILYIVLFWITSCDGNI